MTITQAARDAATIAEIIRDVCELPDRTSPDDWPEVMLVTPEELTIILERHLAQAGRPVDREAIARIIEPWQEPIGPDALAKADAIAALPTIGRDGWLDIASAPKDGTEIILASPKGGSPGYWVHVGWWNEGDSFPWRFIDTFSMDPTGCCDDEEIERVPVNGFKVDAVTHWQPLPAAPRSQPE